MAIETKRMSDWLYQNTDTITGLVESGILASVNDNVDQLQDGVFIMTHRNYDNYPVGIQPKEWIPKYQDNGNIADGVLLLEGGHQLVIAPTETQLKWATQPFSCGGFSTGDRVEVMQDWAGKENTKKIIGVYYDTIAMEGIESPAAKFCNEYTRVNANGKGLVAGQWWLPSMGELMMIYANLAKINHALSLIDGADLLDDDVMYWSSTEFSGSEARAWTLGIGDGYRYYYGDKTASYKVRPVSAFYI